jgi:mono/diheme cytochrome c family protein
MDRRARGIGSDARRAWRRSGWAKAIGSLALILVVPAGACQPQESQETLDVAVIDSVLAELGGPLTASLERGQRWRMISSIGVGLPPNDFQPEDLPEPGSRGAGLLQVYCIQCHWLPTPQMHSAEEWPILVRRNLLRMEQLNVRLGGPLTTGLVGETVMTGYENPEIPSPADVDTLLAYLQRYSLPVAEPGELTPGAGRELFIRKCSVCHETPSPRAHTATGWDRLIGEMQAIMAISNVEPLSNNELDAISAYLRERAVR